MGNPCCGLIPKQSRKNDWEPKGTNGLFIGIRKNGSGFRVYLTQWDKVVETSHLFFKEPSINPENHAVNDILVNTLPRDSNDYHYLIGLFHFDPDDNLTYVTTRVGKLKGFIVGYRAVARNKQSTTLIDTNDPIHIKDVEKMTYDYYLSFLNHPNAQNLGIPKIIQVHESAMDNEIPQKAHRPSKNDELYEKNLEITGQKIRQLSEKRQMLPRKGKKTNIQIVNISHRGKKDISLNPVTSKRKTIPTISTLNTTNIEEYAYFFSGELEPDYKSAIRGPDADRWRAARDKEISGLTQKNCWVIAKVPSNTPIVGSRYICKVKIDDEGNVDKYKVRLVAQGFSQVEGVNYYETYSPVVKMPTIRIFFAIVAINDLLCHQLDVKTAYINADLDETIFMRAPDDFNLPPGYALKLNKSIYGLKQSGLNWHMCVSKFLINIGFSKLLSDSCIFVMNHGGEDLFMVILYVDDMLLASRKLDKILTLKRKIQERFDIEDLGEVKFYLGLKINRDYQNKIIYVNQKHYILRLLKKYDLENCREVQTTLPRDFKFDVEEIENLSHDQIRYIREFPVREIIGALNYLAVCTRPDITSALNIISRYQDKANLTICQGCIHILKYLKTTMDLSLKYSGKVNSLVGFSDSDWAGDLITRRSTSGYIFYFGNSPIIWQSKLQPIVALSSTEAEYMALTNATQEALWIRSLLKEFGFSMNMPTTVWCDNKGAIDLTYNPIHHKRTKHIDLRYHFIRQIVQEGHVVIDTIDSSEMLADLLAKIVTPQVSGLLLTQLMGHTTIKPSPKRLRPYTMIMKKQKTTEEGC